MHMIKEGSPYDGGPVSFCRKIPLLKWQPPVWDIDNSMKGVCHYD